MSDSSLRLCPMDPRDIPSMGRIAFHLLPLAAVMAVIFYFSHQPGNAVDLPDFFQSDKVFHALAYGGLALTAFHAQRPFPARFGQVPRLFAIALFCVLYGMSDEYHQSFIPGRDMSIFDVAADTVGALAVLFLLNRFFPIPSQKS